MSENTPTPEILPNHPRPLSPHLQVYNLPMTARMSISHRFTGLILTGGLLVIASVLICAAIKPECYERIMALFATKAGTAALFVWSLAFFYHMCNGLRHLLWDMVLLFKLRNARIAGWIVIFAALGLTVSTWYCARHYAGDNGVVINEQQ